MQSIQEIFIQLSETARSPLVEPNRHVMRERCSESVCNVGWRSSLSICIFDAIERRENALRNVEKRTFEQDIPTVAGRHDVGRSSLEHRHIYE